MKLLIITQKIDISDDNLGFFHRWIEEFAKYCELVIVICLQKGEFDLPENVKILSLGKERNNFKIFKKLKYARRFYQYIYRERKNYDAVFVHMNPEYIALGGLFWRIWRKKISLWYTHKSVNWKLRLAEKIVEKIFTASKESFRLPSNKVEIMGHGIDTEKFQIINHKSQITRFKIITAGRIASVKNLHILIEAAEILKKQEANFEIRIAGAPITEKDKEYLEKLERMITEKKLEDSVYFTGSIPYKEIEKFYQTGDLFVNLSNTGSLDKSALEAMACGVNVLVSNEAFFGVLPEENLIKELDVVSLAEKIKQFMLNNIPAGNLREIAVKNHDLKNLIKKLIENMK